MAIHVSLWPFTSPSRIPTLDAAAEDDEDPAAELVSAIDLCFLASLLSSFVPLSSDAFHDPVSMIGMLPLEALAELYATAAAAAMRADRGRTGGRDSVTRGGSD